MTNSTGLIMKNPPKFEILCPDYFNDLARLKVEGGGTWLEWFSFSGTEILQWIVIIILIVLYFKQLRKRKKVVEK